MRLLWKCERRRQLEDGKRKARVFTSDKRHVSLRRGGEEVYGSVEMWILWLNIALKEKHRVLYAYHDLVGSW